MKAEIRDVSGKGTCFFLVAKQKQTVTHHTKHISPPQQNQCKPPLVYPFPCSNKTGA